MSGGKAGRYAVLGISEIVSAFFFTVLFHHGWTLYGFAHILGSLWGFLPGLIVLYVWGSFVWWFNVWILLSWIFGSAYIAYEKDDR